MTASSGSKPGQPTVRAKSAAVNTREYDEALMHKRFADISAAIHARPEKELGFNSVDVTPRSLSVLTGNLRHFVESALGKNADPETRKITKFPHKLFMDYKPDGSLDIMLCECLNFKALHGLRRLEFTNPDKRQLYFDLLFRIEKSLKEARLLPMIKVFFARTLPTSFQPALRAIVSKRGVTVSTTAAATHIVYPDPEGSTAAETEGTDYCRPLEIKDSMALVHWWYYPDSYDSWIPREDVDGMPEPPENLVGPWHVQMRWLHDTDLFNEWMNEIDYEVPDEMRIKVIPAPRSELPPATKIKDAPEKMEVEKPLKPVKPVKPVKPEKSEKPEKAGKPEKPQKPQKPEKTEKISKKRRRMSSKHHSDALSEKDRSSTAPRGEKANLAGVSDDSEEETVRKPKRHGEGKERRGKDQSSSGRSRKESGDAHPRKKARLSEESRGGRDEGGSIKVRINLKAPHERSKNRGRDRGEERSRDRGKEERSRDRGKEERNRDRVKEERSRDRGKEERSRDRGKDAKGAESVKTERKDANVESKGMKIRVKLDKLNESQVPEKASSKDMHKDSDMEDASSVKSKAPVSLIMKGNEVGKAAPAEVSKESGAKSDSAPALSKSEQKHSTKEDGPVDEAGQEQKRPFSRRRSKKKERRHPNRMPGVSTVDDAIPIPEGEVPRIRNISNEGVDATMNDSVPNRDKDGLSASEGEEEAADGNGAMDIDEKGKAQKRKANGNAEENAMDIDTDVGNSRAIAVSEKVVSGDRSNVPISGADVVEALPPVTIRIPAHARWFRKDAIHDIEKRSLSEFFNSRGESKTPLVYKKYRDFMIDVWRQNPGTYLTATAARRHLSGDVCAILRVHAFLEHWGLVNYGTEPESKPYLSSSLRPRNVRSRPMQLDAVVQEHLNGVPRLLFFDEPRPPRRDNAPVSLKKAMEVAKEKCQTDRNKVLSRRELYALAAATKYECDACGNDCSRMRYHCVGNADMELCPACFANGKYPPTLSSRDFEQLTTVLSSEAYDGTVWSEAEVLLLFEGLEKYGDNWNKVAEHVGTKNKNQCVCHFLRVPIEDSFLEDQVGKWESDGDEDMRDEGNACGEHKFTGPLLPFHDTANPIMAQVAFLASSVDPEVAAAAAQAALNKIMADSGQNVSFVKEEKSTQAEALLQEPEMQRSHPGLKSGNIAANGSNLSSLPKSHLDAVAVESAAAVGLAAAVARARDLLEAETREMEREFAAVVETKMRGVELKMKEVDKLGMHMRKERERLEKHRQVVFVERVDSSLMRVAGEVESRKRAAAVAAQNAAVAARNAAVAAQSGTHTGAVGHIYGGVAQAAPRPPVGANPMHLQQGGMAVQHSGAAAHHPGAPVQHAGAAAQHAGSALQHIGGAQHAGVAMQLGGAVQHARAAVGVPHAATGTLQPPQHTMAAQQSSVQAQQALRRGTVPLLQAAIPMQQAVAAPQQGAVPVLQAAVAPQVGMGVKTATTHGHQAGVGVHQGAAQLQRSGVLPMQHAAHLQMHQGGMGVQQGVGMQQMHQNTAAMQQAALAMQQRSSQARQSGMGYQTNPMVMQPGAVPVQRRPVALQPGPTGAGPAAQQPGGGMRTDLPPGGNK